ncbi:MAG: DUF2029 domain-containing protein [Deltaproteobacteria bacterium]|nr:MAG: DUF2029 domain-containing protein [Deltaproteobacteria bacterium]
MKSSRPLAAALVPYVERSAAACAVVACVALAAAVAARIGFPLELEWMEDGALQHARWIASGRPVYPPPSADFVPYLYTPLYPMVLAALSFVAPLDFVAARTVSVLAACALFLAIHRIVVDEGKPRAHAIVAVGLFASAYVFTYRWLDLARADTLMLALAAWGLWALRRGAASLPHAAAAGALLGLAFWTKQTAFVLLVAGGAAALVTGRRYLWATVVVAGIVGLGGLAWGQSASDGWLWRYVYELHQAHPFNHQRFRAKSWGMLLHAAPFAAVAVVVAGWAVLQPFVVGTRRLDDDRAARRRALWRGHAGVAYWVIVWLGALVASALGYSTLWAEANAFLPAAAFGAVAVSVLWPVQPLRARLACAVLCGAQVIFGLFVEPTFQPVWDEGIAGLRRSYRLQRVDRTIPTEAARLRARALRDGLETASQPVFALHRPWWNVLSGGDGHAGAMGLNDVDRATRRRIEAGLAARIRGGAYGSVFTDTPAPPWLRTALRGRYRMTERRTGDARVLPMTGWLSIAGMTVPQRHPQFRFDPVAPRMPPAGATIVADFEGGGLWPMRRVGGAFPGRGQRLFEGRLPAFGPHGGEFYVCSTPSTYRPKATGRLESPPLELNAGDRLVVHVAATGADGISVALADEDGRDVVARVPASPPYVFGRIELAVSRAGRYVLSIRDGSKEHVVCVDDVWRVPAG